MLQRILTALIFAVVFDLVLFDGRDIDAVKRLLWLLCKVFAAVFDRRRTALGSHFING